jgi:hypothetical protein
MKKKALLTASIISYTIYFCFYVIALIATTVSHLARLIITAIEKEQAKDLPPVRFDLEEIDEVNPKSDIPDPWMLAIAEDEVESVNPKPTTINQPPKLLLLPPAKNIQTPLPTVTTNQLESKSIRELRKIGKRLNIKGYSQLKKAVLIERIESIAS